MGSETRGLLGHRRQLVRSGILDAAEGEDAEDLTRDVGRLSHHVTLLFSGPEHVPDVEQSPPSLLDRLQGAGDVGTLLNLAGSVRPVGRDGLDDKVDRVELTSRAVRLRRVAMERAHPCLPVGASRLGLDIRHRGDATRDHGRSGIHTSSPDRSLRPTQVGYPLSFFRYSTVG